MNLKKGKNYKKFQVPARATYKFSLSHNKSKQSRNQQASTKSVKMSPFLFFTLLIVAASGFEVNQKAAAGRVSDGIYGNEIDLL